MRPVALENSKEMVNKTLKQAAAVIIKDAHARILVGQRTLSARSFPGFLAFPGGAVEPDDPSVPLRLDSQASRPADVREERACALRELGEETGYWYVVQKTGAPLTEVMWDQFSQRISDGELLSQTLNELGCVLDDSRLVPLGEWTTPEFMPRRYRVRQFIIEANETPQRRFQTCDELDDVAFTSVVQILDQWRSGEALLLPPILSCVQTLAQHVDEQPFMAGTIEELRALPKTTSNLREIIEGVCVQPLRTPTLPPAAHTNTIIVGASNYFLIDPATPYEEERHKLDEMIERLALQQRHPIALVLTHHHHDHIGDVERLHQKYQIPIWAHVETARLVPFEVQRHLHDGDSLICEGIPARAFEVIHTPGHAPGHLCFWEKNLRLLIAGDMVAATGSILIDPEDGHMGTYLSSLKRLIELHPRRLVAAHGPLLADGQAKLVSQYAHREKRQDAVHRALLNANVWLSVDEIVPLIYGGEIPVQMFPLAARSLESNLQLLREQGLAESKEGKYAACE